MKARIEAKGRSLSTKNDPTGGQQDCFDCVDGRLKHRYA